MHFYEPLQESPDRKPFGLADETQLLGEGKIPRGEVTKLQMQKLKMRILRLCVRERPVVGISRHCHRSLLYADVASEAVFEFPKTRGLVSSL